MIVVIGGYLQNIFAQSVCVFLMFFFCVLSELAKMRSTAKLPVDCLSAVNPGFDVLLVSKSTQ
jgi:hypothetical protein